MRVRQFVASLAGAVWLAGCVNIPSESKVAGYRAALTAAPVCCASIREARVLPLPLEPQEFQINALSTVMELDDAKSYVVVYQLPSYTKPYSIRFASVAEGTQLFMSLFVPRFALYDQDFNLTRRFQESDLRNRGFNLERTIFINPSNAGERYVAIYSASLATPIKRSLPVILTGGTMVGAAYVNFTTGHDSSVTLLPSPMGKMEIEVLGLQAKQPGG